MRNGQSKHYNHCRSNRKRECLDPLGKHRSNRTFQHDKGPVVQKEGHHFRMSRNIQFSLLRHGVPLVFVKDEAGVKVMQYPAHGKSDKRGHGGGEAVFSPQGKKHSTLRVPWANQNSNVELVRIRKPRKKDHTKN
jgi:hypothetical protein